jgi:hypothetical protein
MLDASFVREIIAQAHGPVVLDVNGRKRVYTPAGDGGWGEEDLALPEVAPSPLAFGTLNGLATYLAENRDKLTLTTLAAHIHDVRNVSIGGPLIEEFKQRFAYARASLDSLVGKDDGFTFGQFLNHEVFVIQLQSKFVRTPELEKVLAFIGSIRGENVRQVDDDGTTQTVTARAGAVLKSEAAVPNPVILAPYRTFREVGQPESRFILRLKSGDEGEKPTLALFEADGSTWRVDAISNIALWLKQHLPSGIAIYY